jgi:alpha-1,2-mannosyltransferase
VTSLVVGLDDMRTYSIIMIARDVSEWSGFVLNHSVTGIVARIFGNSVWTEPLVQLPYLSFPLTVLLKLSILIYTVLKIRKMTDREKLDSYAFCLTLVTMLLLSPITWGHIFPVLILPICLLLREYIDEPSLKKSCLLLIIIVFCLSLPDVLIARKLMEIHHPFRMSWYSMLLTLGQGAGLILLWIVLSRRDINRPA